MRSESKKYRIGSVIWDFDALDRDEVLSLLVQCIARVSQIPKKVLAMYYHENLQLAEIATELGLTEYEIDQMRARTLDLLQTVLAAQLSVASNLSEIRSSDSCHAKLPRRRAASP